MVRKFEAFDQETIKSEFRNLPSDDRAALTEAMKSYQMDLGVGYKIKSYSNGISMITGSGNDQGRGLFFYSDGSTVVLLIIYKKESQKVPASVLATAKKRKDKYLSG